LLGILRAAIRRAQAREYVRRNVALLCDPPKGQVGRPSKSLSLDQATRLLAAADFDAGPMHAYVPVSLLIGARTEELRALEWDRVDLDGVPAHPSTCGDQCAPAETPRPESPAGPSNSQLAASTYCVPTGWLSWRPGLPPVQPGRTPASCSRPMSVSRYLIWAALAGSILAAAARLRTTW
jgi:hypothetical protein